MSGARDHVDRVGLLLFAGAVAVWWALRGLGLLAMRAFSELEFEPVDFAIGAGSDVLLVASVFVLMTAAHRAVSQGGRRALLVTTVLLAIAMALLRVADSIVCYFALSHATATVWHHISPGSLGYVTDPRVASVLVAIVCLGGALAWTAHRAARHFVPAPAKALPLVLLAIALWLPAIMAPALQRQHPQHWAVVPEVNAVVQLARSRGSHRLVDPATVVVPHFDAPTLTALRAAGLIAANQDPNGPWPLLREGIGAHDDLPATADAAISSLATTGSAKPHPHVILVLVESLNAGFTGLHPSSRHADLMPNLTRLSRDMTVVRGFNNATSPTAGGLLASLCATIPSSAVQDIEVGGSVDRGAAFRCLADVLGEHGYSSHFARGASKVYMACEATLRGHGFDRVIGREDLQHLYPDRPTNSWGYHDQTLVDFLLDDIGRLRGQGKPFFYATLTVNSHLPGFPEPDCPVPDRLHAEPILAGYFCADRALGRLLDGLKKMGAWRDTVIVVTGDHAQLPTSEVKALIGVDELFGTFAPMPLLLHDPLHRLPRTVDVLASQIDLAPTLVHLLGARASELPHSFLGYSIFGERRRHPLIVGRTGQRSGHIQSGTARNTFPIGGLASMCERGTALLADGSSPVSACQLDAWFHWLDAVWRGHRLFPADRYRPATRQAGDLLRLKWLRYDAKEERERKRQGVSERVDTHGHTER